MAEPAPREQNRIDDAREIWRHPYPFPGSALSSIEYYEVGVAEGSQVRPFSGQQSTRKQKER